MKFFTGTIICMMMIAACSTPEVLSDEPLEIEPGERVPEWYNANSVSSTDSTHFNGYSMATAVDSLEAINLGNESAIANLRYEIDKFTEDVREMLATDPSSEQYDTPQFIIKLRNSVQDLQLTDSIFKREFGQRDDDVVQVYTRATINRSEIIDRLAERLSDESYIRALHVNREEL